MENTKSELIKIATKLLVDCPVSNCIEDWDFPLYLSNKQLNRIQRELDKFDSWRKELAQRIKSAADTIEVKNTSTDRTNMPCHNCGSKQRFVKKVLTNECGVCGDIVTDTA